MVKKIYYTILILDACNEPYDEISNKPEWKEIREPALRVIDLMKTDKELGPDYGTWSYRIIKHEEDDECDYQSIYKVYKYRGRYKIKRDIAFEDTCRW